MTWPRSFPWCTVWRTARLEPRSPAPKSLNLSTWLPIFPTFPLPPCADGSCSPLLFPWTVCLRAAWEVRGSVLKLQGDEHWWGPQSSDSGFLIFVLPVRLQGRWGQGPLAVGLGVPCWIQLLPSHPDPSLPSWMWTALWASSLLTILTRSLLLYPRARIKVKALESLTSGLKFWVHLWKTCS